MGKLSNSANDVLPEFQKFLLEKKLVPDKKAPFYAHWVNADINSKPGIAIMYTAKRLSIMIPSTCHSGLSRIFFKMDSEQVGMTQPERFPTSGNDIHMTSTQKPEELQ